ncbi:MAG: hypothetical protein DHS20C18_28870 [Saprospiraceae bacterium]|nr:MAG: hypothetical protein DHS20C18_28870 [Saprospiraceae bacterium]
MKKSLIILACHFIILSLYGQTFQVQGTILDAKQNSALPGAHITLSGQHLNQNLASASEIDGHFQFTGLTNGDYQLSVTFIGFDTYVKPFSIRGASLDLEPIRLQEANIQLDAVEVTEKVLPAIQLGDTTQFNAEAFKTLPDANAEDLITKMPTVVIDQGKVQAQGEDVKQVLVDGKPFFGNDPTAALRNLPAEVIDKIQIFDQQSDQAQFTGFDDGETSKTINIITKTNMRTGQFGKLFAGYGTDGRYQLGGNVNIFNGDQRISIIGQSNNINEQNFATEDLLGVVGSSGGGRGGRGGGGRGGRGGRGGGQGSVNDFLVSQQGGISGTNAAGINFTDKWGEKLEVTASYFFNRSSNTSEQILARQFVDTEEFLDRYTEQSLSESTNTNHRVNARLEYKINDKNTIIWRPQFTWQGNDGQSTLFGQNFANEILSAQTENDFQSDLRTLSFNNNLMWRHQFEKPRRTISINISSGYAPKKGDSYLYSENLFIDGSASSDTLNQYASLDQLNWNASANIQYTEPIAEYGMLMLNYRSSWQQEESDKETFDQNEETDHYDLLNPQLSNVFSNDYFTQQIGGGYTYRKKEFMFTTRANVQWASLMNEQTFPYTDEVKHDFYSVLPMAMLRYQFSKTENFRIIYRTNTQLPNIEQLQNVLDNSNSLQLRVGNPNLVQAYQHQFFGRYSKTNTEKSTVFFAGFGGGFTKNYLGTSTYLGDGNFPILDEYEVEPGAQLSQYVNLDGYRNARTFISYGFPVKALGSNLNFDLNANYTRSPGLVNEQVNYSENMTTGIGITLGSNISDRIDFTISSRSNYSMVNNSINQVNNSNYFNQRTSLKIGWIFSKGFIFRSNLSHEFYDGLSAGLDQHYWLWSMSIGKKFLKDDRGEISLSVFDLLNQNTSLSRNITETYLEDVQTNVLQQYFMLSFKYDLRNFKVK